MHPQHVGIVSNNAGEEKVNIATMAMRIGGRSKPRYDKMSLQEFFIDKAHSYKENSLYPFAFPGHGFATDCSVLEGGCQFAFDRNPSAEIVCVDCGDVNCGKTDVKPRCGKMRYFRQPFSPTRIYILDLDLNDTRPRTYQGFCKYHTLTYSEELQLRQMESDLQTLDAILFFYRTKCNGFRIGFEAEEPIADILIYEELAKAAKEAVKKITPDRKLDRQGWFRSDQVGGKRAEVYWGYPRMYHPVWLNPTRTIP